MKRSIIRKNVLAAAAVAGLVLTGCQSEADSNRAETEALKEQIAQLEQQIAVLQQQQAAGNGSAPDTGSNIADDGNVQSQTGGESDGAQTGAAGQQAPNDTNTGNGQQSQSGTVDGNNQQSQNDTVVGNSQQVGGNTGSDAQVPYDVNPGYGHSPGHDEGYSHNQSHYAGDSSAAGQQGVSAGGLTTYTMDELGAMVDAFVTKASAAAPGGQAAQDMEQFFALKQEEKQIDDTLDSHEDELEYLYKTGVLTREVYKQEERKLELLEDQLDDIEDQLEYVFGIKD